MELRVGYFAHWYRPAYKLEDFLRDLGFSAQKIDYTQKNYLESFDVVLIEQNGFNDYIENDELYIQDWVKRGGICLFFHQDYMRWVPYFLPKELGHTQLIYRHVDTIQDYKTYMMPWIESCGQELFRMPNRITPDEMLDWNVAVNSFGIATPPEKTQPVVLRTAAQSCFLANPAWEVLGSYMDPAVKDGALILQAKYGKGLYFLNQLMMPEVRVPDNDRCFRFWKKYYENLMAYFTRLKAGLPAPKWTPEPAELPAKKNYKLAIHMHALDWYGCDAAPGVTNALMRYRNFDICSLAVKDTGPYNGKLNPTRFSDDKTLFLDGQEYHPFNWGCKYAQHNAFHILAIGIDPDAYTPEYTKSLYSDAEVENYLKKALRHIHEHGGAACATHPYPHCNYWTEYDYDAVDMEPFASLAGTDIEAYWLSGRKITVMNSVDFFGVRRYYDNPALNFTYLKGEKPCRDSVVKAIKAGHVIAGTMFDEADITLGNALPGDSISTEEAAKSELHIAARIFEGDIRKVRIYSGAKVILEYNEAAPEIDKTVSLAGLPLDRFIRVEVEGEEPLHLLASTPFYLDK